MSAVNHSEGDISTEGVPVQQQLGRGHAQVTGKKPVKQILKTLKDTMRRPRAVVCR